MVTLKVVIWPCSGALLEPKAIKTLQPQAPMPVKRTVYGTSAFSDLALPVPWALTLRRATLKVNKVNRVSRVNRVSEQMSEQRGLLSSGPAFTGLVLAYGAYSWGCLPKTV